MECGIRTQATMVGGERTLTTVLSLLPMSIFGHIYIHPNMVVNNCGGVDEVVFIDVFVCFCCCRILSSQQLMATMCVSLPMDKQALEKHILLTRSKIIHTVSDLFFLMSPGKRRLGKVRTNGTDDCPMITGGLATPESSDSSDLSIYGQLIRNYN